MQKDIRLFAILALLASSFMLVLAQTTQRQPQADLRILVGAQQVKFAVSPEVRELRLVVANQNGETVFDSNPLPVIEFNWNLHAGNNVALPAGLYTYTLSLKLGEAEVPRQHTGHLIIEKGQEQIWLTSSGADNTGAEVQGGEVVIARSPELTTAGTAYVASGRSLSERSGMQRDITGRGLAEGGEPAEPAQKNSAGGLGPIVKTNIPDDLVVNGNFTFTPNIVRDINMQNNTGGLRFYGAPSLTTSPAAAAIQFWGNASGFTGQLYLDSGAHDSAALVFRTTGTGGTIAERMRVTATGNIGIGTNNPSAKFHVAGGEVLFENKWRTETTASTPNLIGGFLGTGSSGATPGNRVTAGVVGAAIVGGGYNGTLNTPTQGSIAGDNSNRVTDWFGTVGGGLKNRAGNDDAILDNAYFATVTGGFNNTASGATSTVGGGDSNTASGESSTVAGGSFNRASGQGSVVPGGQNALASHFGEWAFSSESFANQGDSQASMYTLRAATTNATPTELFLNTAGGQRITIAADRAATFDIMVTGKTQSGDVVGVKFSGAIKNIGGTTSLVGSVTTQLMVADPGAATWTVTVTADDANDSLKITVTGAASTMIRWNAVVRTAELSF